jgi:hypothetical protein
MFFKFQSISTTEMSKALEWFPETPWAFIFRQPVQTIMSHLDKRKGGSGPCLRSRRRPYPEARAALEPWMDGVDVIKASKEAACAGHLNMLCMRALKAYDLHATNSATGKPRGMLINYESLPGAVPRAFLKMVGVIVDDAWMAAVAVNTQFYSKSSVVRRPGLASSSWGGDSKDKDSHASDQMRKWTDRVMNKSYYQMNNASALLMTRVLDGDLQKAIHVHTGVGRAESVTWKPLGSMA